MKRQKFSTLAVSSVVSVALIVLCVSTIMFWDRVSKVLSQTQTRIAQSQRQHKDSKNKLSSFKYSAASQGQKPSPVRPTRNETFNQKFLAMSNEASEAGTVSVIVKLNVTFVPEGYLASDLERQAQRNAIKQSQDTLLSELQPYNPESIKRYEYIPYLAVTVSSSGLAVLQASSQVSDISEDTEMTPATSESFSLIGVPNAHAINYTGVGQTIAILDTGVDKTHSELSGKIISEACYSTNNPAKATTSLCPNAVPLSEEENSGVNCNIGGQCEHGTRVAGIAAGNSGIAKEAKIISIQVNSLLNNTTVVALPSDVMKGLDRVYKIALNELALNGTHSIAAVNISAALGSTKYLGNCNGVGAGSMTGSILNLRSIGIATVIATGNNANSSGSYTDGLSFPACISDAISVGATGDGSGTTPVDVIWPNSQSSSFLSLLAPGDTITSPVPGNGFNPASGTSLAAAHVTGAWALIRQQQKQQQPNLIATGVVPEILKRLQNNGVPITDTRNNVTKTRIKIDSALSCLQNVPADKWKGEYFDNDNLQGNPIMIRDDTSGGSFLDMDFGNGSPGSPCGPGADNFSVRWTRKIYFPENIYRLIVNADNGVRLYVDGVELINQWGISPVVNQTVNLPFLTGDHVITLEYKHQVGTSFAKLFWEVLSENWKGVYFNNSDLSGSPAIIRDDGNGFLNFDWAGGSPCSVCGIGADNFSVRWTRTVNIPAGAYTHFTFTIDDGMRLYIDNTLQYDRWNETVGSDSRNIELSPGNHEIKLEYREFGGNAIAKFSWESMSCISSVSSDRWKGEYFNNNNLSGSPVMVRDDGNSFLDYNWGNGGPHSVCGPGVDNFSIRWTRNVYFDAGPWSFTVFGDNGIKLYVDGQLIVDRWTDTVNTDSAITQLAAGWHEIKLEYFENFGGSAARLSWRLAPECFANVSSNRWKGEYFTNTTFSGYPAMVRDDGPASLSLHKNFGDGSPSSTCGIPVDNFSVRWTTTVNIPESGWATYNFIADDSARMVGLFLNSGWVNNYNSGNKWQPAGNFNIKLELIEYGGLSKIDFAGGVYCIPPPGQRKCDP